MHAARGFVRKIPRYPEKVALYLPRGTSCLAERIAAERGVSPKDLMREALAEALEAMAPTEPLVDEAPAVASAVTIRNADEEARAYVEKTLDVGIAEPFTGVLIERDGQTISAIVFNEFSDRDVRITWAGEQPASVGVLRQVARYVFAQLGCRRVTAITRANDHPAIRSLTRLGFRPEGVMRARFADSDGLIFGLLRSEQKILRLPKW